MIYLAVKKRAEEVARIVAVREQVPRYRVEQARHVVGYLYKLLDRASGYADGGQTAWVKLERADDEFVAKVCWSEDALATVWALEKSDVFMCSQESRDGDTDAGEGSALVRKIVGAVAALAKEA